MRTERLQGHTDITCSPRVATTRTSQHKHTHELHSHQSPQSHTRMAIYWSLWTPDASASKMVSCTALSVLITTGTKWYHGTNGTRVHRVPWYAGSVYVHVYQVPLVRTMVWYSSTYHGTVWYAIGTIGTYKTARFRTLSTRKSAVDVLGIDCRTSRDRSTGRRCPYGTRVPTRVRIARHVYLDGRPWSRRVASQSARARSSWHHQRTPALAS